MTKTNTPALTLKRIRRPKAEAAKKAERRKKKKKKKIKKQR
ncbi:hypothetical protein ACO2FA_13515 [Staphylococcus warneri]